jgi:hypothetical protein
MASNDTPKKNLLKGTPIQFEAGAAGPVIPGELVMLANDGRVQRHNVAADVAEAAFAREQEWAGGSIDAAYPANDRVPYYVCRKGDVVYAFVATGNNVAIGAKLESNGTGALRLSTHGTGTAAAAAAWPIAVALEAVNNASGNNMRIKVRVL